MKAFLKPLKASEEKKYLEAFRTGDSQARNILIEHNMRLVAHVAKKYSQSDHDADDLISIGTVGLIKAVDTFNPDKASRLGTYAAKCIDNEILMFLRAEKKRSREVSLFEPIGTDKEGNVISRVDILEAEDMDITEQIALKGDTLTLYQTFESILSEKEQKVIHLRYGLYGGREYTQREIGNMLGISRSYVSRIEKSALGKLKDAMENSRKKR